MNPQQEARLGVASRTLHSLVESLGTLLGGSGVRRDWALWSYLRARSYSRQSALVAAVAFGRRDEEVDRLRARDTDVGRVRLSHFEQALSNLALVRRLEQDLDLLAPEWTAECLSLQVRERQVTSRLVELEDLVDDLEAGAQPLALRLAAEEAVRLRAEHRAVCIEIEHALGPDRASAVLEAVQPLTQQVRGFDSRLAGLRDRGPVSSIMQALESTYYSLPVDGPVIEEGSIRDRFEKIAGPMGLGPPFLTVSALPWREQVPQRWWL